MFSSWRSCEQVWPWIKLTLFILNSSLLVYRLCLRQLIIVMSWELAISAFFHRLVFTWYLGKTMLTTLYFSIPTYRYSLFYPLLCIQASWPNSIKKTKISLFNFENFDRWWLLYDYNSPICLYKSFSFQYTIKWLQKLNEGQKDG